MAVIDGIAKTELVQLSTEMGIGGLFVEVSHNNQTVAFGVEFLQELE